METSWEGKKGADGISPAVKTHRNESSGLKKKKERNVVPILMLLCDLGNKSSLLEGELDMCEVAYIKKRALIIEFLSIEPATFDMRDMHVW